ncbi:MAG: enoyl-CoA hydratase [Desulfatiglandales bacterium]
MAYTTIILEKKDRIAKITLNRPESMNAVNTTLRQEMNAALDEIENDDQIDVIIVTGAGRAFSAGVDLKELGQSTSVIASFPGIWDRIRLLDKPTIAAVNGFAITGGFELALCCDIIIASENAKFADTHTRVGVLPAGGMTQILPRLVGTKKAKELSFTGNYMTAHEAMQFGLVNRVVPPDELLSTAEALAKDIISNDQVAVRIMKRTIDRGEGMSLEDATRMEQFEHLCHLKDATSAEVERRRSGILDRGRMQSKK